MADRATARRGATAKRGDAPVRTTKLRVVRTPARRVRKDPAAAARAARTNMILLLVPAALLTAIGVIEVYSASSVYAFTTYDEGFNGEIGRDYNWRHGDNYGTFRPTRESRG